MDHKTFELIETKADGEAGEFTALAAVFGNVDLVGDRILPGAFKNTLRKFRAQDDPIPIVLAHQWNDVMAHIGKADPRQVKETDRGLEVTAQLDIHDNAVARQTYKLLKERRLKAFSFGYTVPEGGRKAAPDANEISEIDLVEVGPCLKGANPEAQLQAVKAVQAEETKTSEQEEESASEDGRSEEPSRAKSSPQDPLRKRSRDLVLETLSNGVDWRKPPEKPAEPKHEVPDRRELRRRSRKSILHILSGGTNDKE